MFKICFIVKINYSWMVFLSIQSPLLHFHRGAVTDKCCCGDKLDFVATKALNKEGLNRFVQERSTIAVLNDRLVRLIEVVRTVWSWLQASDVSFECVIPSFLWNWFSEFAFSAGPLLWGRERCSWTSNRRAGGEAEQSKWIQHPSEGARLQPGCSGGKTAHAEGRRLLLLGVSAACSCGMMNLSVLLFMFTSHSTSRISFELVEWHIYNPVKIHNSFLCQQDEILGDTEELKKELEHLKEEYEWIEQQKTLIRQEQDDVAAVIMIRFLSSL